MVATNVNRRSGAFTILVTGLSKTEVIGLASSVRNKISKTLKRPVVLLP